MRIIYAGTPAFAEPALQGLLDAGHDIVMVLTQPDRPAGRGMQLKASPVKQLALANGLRVFQPESLKPAEVQAELASVQAEVMIVAAYGLMIPTAVLQMPTLGCYNIHGSLLPRWRGAAPIHRAILAGDAETGVTIMEVVPKLDAGNMISKWAVAITEMDTTQTLHDAISREGARLMVEAMHTLATTGTLASEVQDESLVTYAHKLEKSESAIDWTQTASQLSRQVRAFNPFPVATATFKQQVCKLWFAQAVHGRGQPGTVLETQPLRVACGEGALEIHTLQMPGGKRQTALQFVQGQHVQVGDQFF
ncbi:methionyl-tRNA formyltransferase [Methylophilus medardicus]|uniref:Methionyl-tRNA formyltransferase n=1 Tax=Methylophilus medardicus TaxID=2588534 RepID=A0A5B8CPU6_9PROT|nr:methionyl-tRNA formyltransferase [Methylophilus medardicus]QDC43271.1 methionyl-tRNA formyltransferase [Methylophilus medardicus]QDC48278.1 methionyl-tRNA formyltransferase [Methylophilus medardicus]QDC51983.1 methionyl-tRNA formyltransferase [Methylophilus medardicus]